MVTDLIASFLGAIALSVLLCFLAPCAILAEIQKRTRR